jgi:hypothetical protein
LSNRAVRSIQVGEEEGFDVIGLVACNVERIEVSFDDFALQGIDERDCSFTRARIASTRALSWIITKGYHQL